MIHWHPDASSPVDLPLSCDPSVQEANTAEALEDYLRTGDPEPLVIPADSTLITVKPLTEAELSTCRREAGRPSVLGEQVLTELRGHEGDAYRVAVDALTDKEYAAAEKARAWEGAFRRSIVRAGLVAVSGWDSPDLAGIASPALRAAVEMEAQAHILRLSTLGPVGKERSGSPSG